MALSFAGVPLVLPTTEVQDWVTQNIDYRDIPIFTYRSWFAPGLNNLTLPTGLYPMKPVVLNKLYWYTGASRWGYGHFLCDATQLQTIHVNCYGADNSQFKSQPFVMDDSKGGVVTTNLYLAFETPLSGIRGVNGMYMITVVDPRYYWWQIETPFFDIDATTTWDDLYGQIQTAIGQAISRDAVDADYLQPSPSLNDNRHQVLPPVFDAIAYNCGQRVVYGLDGKIRVLNFSTSQEALDAQFTVAGPQRAGDRRYGGTL